MGASEIPLPLGTDRCTKGPLLRSRGGETVVEYDYEDFDGIIKWTSIVFQDVLDVQFQTWPGDLAGNADSFHSVHIEKQSARLYDVVKAWDAAFGWHRQQHEKGGSARFKHYMVCFDDDGGVEVIAASCEVQPGRADTW